METKKCTKCGEVKPLSEYYKRRGRKPESPCKVCTRKQMQYYRQNNREKISNHLKTRYREDEEYREKKKRVSKKHREENPEIYKEISRLYRLKNKEKLTKKKAAYYQKHKERDRPKYLARTRARQLKLKNAIPVFIQDCPKEKKDVENIYRLRQIFENATGIKHHVDHMWPLSDGGPHWSGNLQIITAKENMTKGDKVCKLIKKSIRESLSIISKEAEERERINRDDGTSTDQNTTQ